VHGALQGEHSNFCRNTFEVPRSIATEHATSYEAVALHPAQGSREETLSIGKGVSSDIAIHSCKEGSKHGKKRRK
jgi:hypothetical protein